MNNYVVLENIKANLIGVMEDVKYFQCIERSMTIGIKNQKVYKDTGTMATW